MYAAGLLAGLPGAAALAFLALGPWFGWKVAVDSPMAWLAIEAATGVAALGLTAAAVAQSRQRRADGWQDYAGPSPALVLGALLAIVMGVGVPMAAGLRAAGIDTKSAAGTLLLILVYLASYLGLVHILVVRPGALTWRDVAHPRHLAPEPAAWVAPPVPRRPETDGRRRLLSAATAGLAGDVLLALALLPAAVFASGLLNLLLLSVLHLRSQDVASPVPISTAGLDPLITFVTVAVVVPLGEETFFRGFATNAWARSLARNQAIARSALFFALVHVLNVANTDPGLAMRAAAFNFGARLPIAFALSWLYLRRRSILASATLHGSFNGLILLLSLASV